LSNEDLTVTGGDAAPDWSRVGSNDDLPARTLVQGNVIANRYEILQLLGEGGMGAVYKARDRELDRLIALKVIRPELAGHPRVLQRFKQELLLARQVTHKNVIRIFDLGVFENLKFITMEFVEGRDLSSLLDQRSCTVPEALDIIQQTCRALEAAHGENVIHRDLKPQNIMLGEGGRVYVMDFGLARSLESTGLTQAGALLGTPAYMSPEQALGNTLDARSDLFSLGIIFYEMLTGVVPFKADSVLASMLKRTQGAATPPLELAATIPKDVSDVVMKCLANDPANRYQSVGELLSDVDILVREYGTASSTPSADGTSRRGGGSGGGSVLSTAVSVVQVPEPAQAPPAKAPRLPVLADSVAWKWIAAMVILVVGALGGILAWMQLSGKSKSAPVAPMTVMIADFNNHTGDAVFSGTLESTLKLALEGASFLSAYDRTRVKELGLKAISGTLDEAQAEGIAASQGLNVVVSGSLDRRGTDYQLSVRAVQTVTGKVITTAEETAPNKDQVLFAVTKLGIAVRKALGDATSESAQRLSMETLTAASLEAVHEYAAGLDTMSTGKVEEAQQRMTRAVDLDPNFGIAYTVMASAARNLGRQQDAEKYIREALKHIDRMTERERYRTRAYLYLLTSDHQKCVDEYGALLEKYPSDSGAYTNISVCQMYLHNVPKALDAARRAVAILPKRGTYHGNLAMNLALSGDSQGAAKEAAEAVKLGYANGYLHQAYAALLQEQPAQAAEAYQKFEKINPSDAAGGLADLAIYEGRLSDAAQMLERGAAVDLGGRKPDPDAASTKFWTLANVQLLRGQKGPALAAANRALELSQAFKTRFMTAQVYVAFGEAAKARELANGLSSELQVEPQVFAKLIDGEAALKAQDARGAVKLFTEANNLLDTWIGRFDLGRAYLEIGAFAEADSEFDRCIKRRGEALSLFLDLPTYGFFPPVYYYQGRARQGMKSAGFGESYQKYLSIRGKAGEDALLADIRRRLHQ
jgi:serine/threonine protein kinase/tetratricopeptide (TPR) repeat protein